MSWKSLLLEAIVKKSKDRLSTEWLATGAPSRGGERDKKTHTRVLKLIRRAGVKPGMEGRTFKKRDA